MSEKRVREGGASSLGAQGVSHPVHPFVKPFTCVAQTVWMGAGQTAEGLGARGRWALSRQAVDATELRQSGTGAATLGAPTPRAQHDVPPERGKVGWGAMRTRCHLSAFAAAPVTAEQAWICHDCCLSAWSLRLCEISIAVIAPSTSCLLASTSSAEPARSWLGPGLG